jgi:hypothetical protein
MDVVYKKKTILDEKLSTQDQIKLNEFYRILKLTSPQKKHDPWKLDY